MQDEIGMKIIKIIENCSNKQNCEISLKGDLREYGINSLIFIKIVLNVEKEFKISFDAKSLNFEKYKTVNDLKAYVESKSNASL